ncbi:MAG: hypothetical protein HDR57_04740 [Treponema sp.]|nr:hypothetical protein [Treponema sp.]
MKKLITGAVAAIAILFGFAACSGEYSKDLHENDVQPLTVTGLCGTEVVPMTIPDGGDGTEQYLKFVYAQDTKIKGLDGNDKALKDGWGGIANPQLKIIPQTALKENREPDWSMDYAGPHDIPIYVKAGEDWKELDYRGKDGNTNPGNIFLDGLILNEEYTLSVKFNAASNRVDFKVLGPSSDPSAITFVLPEDSDFKNFPLKDKDGSGLNYSMEKAGSVYTYSFISKADEKISLKFKNDLAGTFGFEADKSPNDATTLVLNGAGNFIIDAKKGVEYKLTINSPSITAPEAKFEVINLLEKAKIKGNFRYAENFYEVDVASAGYQFFAERSELEFTVIRHDDSVWGKKTNNLALDADDSVEFKYASIDDVSAKVDPIRVSNLKVDTCYKIEFKEDGATLSAKVITVPLTDLSNAVLVGGFQGEKSDRKTEGETTYWEFVYSGDGWGGSDGEQNFKIQIIPDDWGTALGGKAFSAEKLAEGVSYDGEGDNAKLTGLKQGTKYKLIVKPGFGMNKVSVDVIE